MNIPTNQTKPTSTWNRMVHTSFRKVMAFDILFMTMGIIIGAGIGAYLGTAGIVY